MDETDQQVLAHVNNQIITGGIHNITRNGHIKVYADNSKEKGIDILRAHVASGAHHDSGKVYEKPKCHPGTREAILKEIMNWVREPICSYPILWQHGPAGSGKSSIARSIAAMCKKDGLLAADFFFFRTDNSLNNSEHLMATLAYQVMLAMPELRNALGQAILRDPLILSSSLDSQLRALVVEPIIDTIPSEIAPNARLIIIDGLDECGDWRAQQNIISIFSSALADASLPFRLMIASRPEQGIREAFQSDSTDSLTWQLALDDRYDPDTDIKLFLNARFSGIKATHPAKQSLSLSSWPSKEAIDFLVQKASGQFIYASTVMNFIESRHRLPSDMLDIILKLKPRLERSSPYAELDALYAHIFESVHDFEQVRQVFACLLFSKIDSSIEPGMKGRQLELTPSIIANFLGFRPGQLQVALVDLHSVLHIPQDDSPDTIHLLHASLPDFLCDKERSRKFYIDQREAHGFLAQRCANVLLSIDSFPETFVDDEYLIHGFVIHCSKSAPTQDLRFFLRAFDFIAWLDLRFNRRVVHHQLEELAGNESTVDAFDADVRCLFRWLLKQFPGDGPYQQYINNFDKWLRSKLIASSNIPKSRYLFASLALNNSLHEWDMLAVNLDSATDYHTLRMAALLHGGEGNPRYANRIAGPNAPDLPVYQFFWDRERAKEFYPQKSWLIDLATFCLHKVSRVTFLDRPIILVTLQRIISHLPMDRDIYELLLKYPLSESLPMWDPENSEPEYLKAFMSIKQFIEDYESIHPVEVEQVLQDIDSEAKHKKESLAKTVRCDVSLVHPTRLETAKKGVSKFYTAVRNCISRKKTK